MHPCRIIDAENRQRFLKNPFTQKYNSENKKEPFFSCKKKEFFQKSLNACADLTFLSGSKKNIKV